MIVCRSHPAPKFKIVRFLINGNSWRRYNCFAVQREIDCWEIIPVLYLVAKIVSDLSQGRFDIPISEYLPISIRISSEYLWIAIIFKARNKFILRSIFFQNMIKNYGNSPHKSWLQTFSYALLPNEITLLFYVSSYINCFTVLINCGLHLPI